VAALDDDLRRRMYAYCRQVAHPVTRDEAAAHVGISRKLAAFHLDKLVDAGLLRAHYAQAGGIRRVGRAPKVYRPTDDPVRVSIPERRHDLLAELLLHAVVQEPPDEQAASVAVRVARDRGAELGAEERADGRLGRLSAERALTVAQAVLTRHGFEPHRHGPTAVRLRNCPFQPLAAKEPALVCGVNHAFLSGFLTGLGARSVQAVLVPTPGECCVRLTVQG
jgi:predicted ArsR family transcriptional regulator